MPSVDGEVLRYFVAGAAVLAGLCAFSAFKQGGRFFRTWFSVFSGLIGWLAIGLIALWLLREYPNVLLALFWAVVLTVAGVGIWADRKERKKRKD